MFFKFIFLAKIMNIYLIMYFFNIFYFINKEIAKRCLFPSSRQVAFGIGLARLFRAKRYAHCGVPRYKNSLPPAGFSFSSIFTYSFLGFSPLLPAIADCQFLTLYKGILVNCFCEDRRAPDFFILAHAEPSSVTEPWSR